VDSFEVIRLVVTLLVVFSAVGLAYALFIKPGEQMRDMMPSPDAEWAERTRRKLRDEEEIERIKEMSGHARAEHQKMNLARRLYKAGVYSAAGRKKFIIWQICMVIGLGTLLPVLMYYGTGNTNLTLLGGLLGLMIGYLGPLAWLDRTGRVREEDTMYYLPLVIEQVSIGVSSSLDIGACISHIIETAHERGSHNPVTEMLVHVEKLIRSGFNLQDGLIEVGEASDVNEVKHAFMFLAQCSKHGGEISRQLQELADAVMVQRQVQIDKRIISLPVRATGPLATMFAGFFGMVFAGLFIRVAQASG